MNPDTDRRFRNGQRAGGWSVHAPDVNGRFTRRGWVDARTPDEAGAQALARYEDVPAVYIYVPYSGEGFLYERPSVPQAARCYAR